MINPKTEKLEIELLLEGIFRLYGFDFREYAYSSLKRRILKRVHEEGLKTISGLQEKLFVSSECMERLLLDLSINVTSMYRDPQFYLALRTYVMPRLKTYPFIRIWNAGCSSGEEVYSIAALAYEENIYHKCRIYATDMNAVILKKAKEGIFPLKNMNQYSNNYIKAGGKESLSKYYTAKYDHAIIHSWLKKNIVFSKHNLVTDGSFNEFNLILCRNVMIYFSKPLQDKVHKLLYESIGMFGMLGLGSKESMKFSPYENCYEKIYPDQQLYRRIK